MASFVNGCVFTATSSGTGSFVVSAAATGWQTPAQAGASNGATYRYRAYSADNTQWEIGSGVYTTDTVTLTRVLIEASSNGGSATNFTLPPVVALTMFDEDIVPFASPTFTGAPASTTAAVDTNTTQIATTAYVVAQAASATPLGNMATAVVGTSTRYARADHVHPGREVLTANRTYYVRTDGSNSNNGLTNSAGGAFLTLQYAWNVAAGLDLSIYSLTIDVEDGTYTAGINMTAMPVGGASITIIGNTGTPANVHLNLTTSAFRVNAPLPCAMTIQGFKVTTTGAGLSVLAVNYVGTVTTAKMELAGGSTGFVGAYVASTAGAVIIVSTGQTITGGMPCFVQTIFGGIVRFFGITVTLTGTPAFSWMTVNSGRMGLVVLAGVTFSGAATGTRYGASEAGGIDTAGGGASFIPGNAAGSATAPGWYL